MTARTLEPVNHVAGTTLARAFGPVPAGEEWSVAIRVCAVGTADGAVDIHFRKGDGANGTYRARGKKLELAGDPYDIDTCLTMPAGYELWDRSGNADVAVSYSGTRRLA